MMYTPLSRYAFGVRANSLCMDSKSTTDLKMKYPNRMMENTATENTVLNKKFFFSPLKSLFGLNNTQ